MTSFEKPVVAITLGDPCGIGPEVVVKALWNLKPFHHFIPVVVGELKACEVAARLCDVSLNFQATPHLEHVRQSGDTIWVLNPYPLKNIDLIPAKPTRDSAMAVIKCIEKAVSLALSGGVDAICTAPINKKVLALHGFEFPGHTEFLKFLTGSTDAVMMLAGPRLKVSLVTIHEPLAKVGSILSVDKICRVIKITGESLKKFFNVSKPQIAVCGLNPHAGEEEMFGMEESEIIEPAIRRFSDVTSFNVVGPIPADTVFYRAYCGEFDAVVAMYHDQGLIPVKLLYFHTAVNITLGLPIIRTSVDHGTAYDIAGKGIANSGSMEASIELALLMIRNSR